MKVLDIWKLNIHEEAPRTVALNACFSRKKWSVLVQEFEHQG